MLAIEIRELRKQYKHAFTPTLNNLSLMVKEGSIMGLLGPNGAGKTTTINILCGLVRADGGSALIFGKSINRDAFAVKKEIGVAPQQIALFGELTALENFRYIGRLYGLPERVIYDKAHRLLERMGLEKHADKRVARYSGGMKRRANIIASILHDPRLLILDEPTAGVDVHSRAMILDFLQEYHAGGKTILYTSHLLEEAQKICDDITIVDEGKSVISGSPQELISRTPGSKNLEDVFLQYTGRSIRD